MSLAFDIGLQNIPETPTVAVPYLPQDITECSLLSLPPLPVSGTYWRRFWSPFPRLYRNTFPRDSGFCRRSDVIHYF